MATHVAAWRESLVQEYELPSGNVARLKRCGLMDLAEQGLIPDTLSGLVTELVEQQQKRARALTLTELEQFAGVVNAVVKACFVDPPVSDEGTETSLGVQEIPFTDRAEIFRWANEAAIRLRPFRSKSADALFAIPGGDGVSDQAEPGAGD